jgi:uncharacterized phage protein (TIGR01671 family)
MRALKFRAWNKDDYGGSMYIPILNQDGKSFVFRIIGDGTLDFEQIINDDVVMQFTGILDKNGKEIYEGDIVHFDRNSVGEIRFGTHNTDTIDYYSSIAHGFYIYLGKRRKLPDEYVPKEFKHENIFIALHRSLSLDELFQIQVIGNIYENPELLEKQ